MKALVKYGKNPEETAVRDFEIPKIKDDEVLIEIKYTGICGTDIHLRYNKSAFDPPIPLILGHETAGIIVEKGNKIKNFNKGDRVTVETHADYCGNCYLCRTNNYQLCKKRKGYGFHVHGAFAKYLKAKERILHRLGDNVDFKLGALTEPLCVGYNAIVNKCKINPGDDVLIIGPGPIGIACVIIAGLYTPKRIIMVGTKGDKERLSQAKKFGADYVFDGENPVLDSVLEITNGLGVDVVVDTAGVSETLELSINSVKPLGQIVKIGWGIKPVGFSLDPIIMKAVKLQGTFSHTWDVWENVLDLMNNKIIKPSDMITHILPLNRWKEGFELIENKEGLKVLLEPI
jgi:alcohol dehydrogenase/L-iditol 2-dehydrogenase